MGNGRTAAPAALQGRHAALLFQCAYPATEAEWDTANRELRELAVGVSALPPARLHNSGIAGSTVVASFSLAITRWLADRFPGAVALDSIDGDPDHVMAVLGTALDPIEREVLSEQPLPWPAWQGRHLGASRASRLRRLLALVECLPGDPHHREAAFASFRVFVRWSIPIDGPVPTTGRFPRGEIATHPRKPRRRAVLATAWSQGAPARMRLSRTDQMLLVDLARGTLASALGETDPFTHANPEEVECHDLGGGIRVALFACQPPHKLALEAYIGYLLLKNHVPVAYGGGWVLGRQARFGINVLPPFRGGGSALLLAQLLRLYAHRFDLKLFLVEPYQIGRGNRDGIRSGAFWFYWRLGFRPLQRDLLALARAETRRIRVGGGRSPAALLRRLSHAVMAWETPLQTVWTPIDMEAIGARVSAHVLEHFDGDRAVATRSSRRALGLQDGRLAVLLAAIAPPGGWPRRELAAIDRAMAMKDRRELDQVSRLQERRALMQELARRSPAVTKR